MCFLALKTVLDTIIMLDTNTILDIVNFFLGFLILWYIIHSKLCFNISFVLNFLKTDINNVNKFFYTIFWFGFAVHTVYTNKKVDSILYFIYFGSYIYIYY